MNSNISQANRIVNVTLKGGLIGLITDSPQNSLNKRIKKENANGWRVIQVIPSSSGNIMLILFRIILLAITFLLYTTTNGYYLVMERMNLNDTNADDKNTIFNKDVDNELELLKTKLKDNDIIVKIKKTNKLEIIDSKQLEIDKELHLSNKYSIIYRK